MYVSDSPLDVKPGGGFSHPGAARLDGRETVLIENWLLGRADSSEMFAWLWCDVKSSRG